MEKAWLKSYPEGMPAEVPAPPFRSVRELFEQSFSEYPENAAYTNMGRTLSYADLDQLSMQFACYLQQTLGLMRGERVAIMHRTSCSTRSRCAAFSAPGSWA